jgi:hypothetical protein
MEVKYEHRFTEIEGKIKNNSLRIEEIEKRQDNLDDLVGTVKVLADREKRVEGDVREIKDDVKSLKDKPAKRWETVVTCIITAIVAALVGFALAQIGIK